MSLRPIVEGDPCCYCRAEIIFARTRAGKLMPLDAEPVQAKLVPPLSRWLYDADEIRTWPATDADPNSWVFVPHFGTCPETQKTEPKNAELLRRWKENRG